VQCGRDHAGNCIIFINYAPLISNAPRPLLPIFPLHHSANANTSGAGAGAWAEGFTVAPENAYQSA